MSEPRFQSSFLVGQLRGAYLKLLERNRVPINQRVFCVNWVDRFVDAADGRAPSSLNEHDIHTLIASFGRPWHRATE